MFDAFTSSLTETLAAFLRALVLLAVLIGPMAGFAAAASSDGAGKAGGAGFVLYVSLLRSRG